MFIPIEEALAKGIPMVGTGKLPDFVIGQMVDMGVGKNASYLTEFADIIKESLHIRDYSKQRIKHLIFTTILYKDFEIGVRRYEQKYYKKKSKKLLIDLRNPHYEAFCKATKQEALRIMASEILRGSEKFLKDEPDFNFPKFYDDVKALFVEKGLVE